MTRTLTSTMSSANSLLFSCRRLVLLLLVLPGVFASPSIQAARFTGEPTPLAVLYADGDEMESGQFAEILDAIQAMPTVRLVPIRLSSSDLRYAEATGNRLGLANRVAMNEGNGAIAVLYPETGEPYRSVFGKIIEGIEHRARKQVTSYAVTPGTDASALRATLRAKDVRVVIALGRQGMQTVDALNREFGVVVGGVTAVPDEDARDRAVLSLSPDPALLFTRLRALAPQVKRVHVIYDPRQNGWLLRLAREAARSQGLELVAQEARDLKTAVRLYQEVLTQADPERDALWLPQDPTTVDEATILPLVLRETWNRRLPVFSSSFGHVRRGVLFSLYPDNLGLGRDLAGAAMDLIHASEGASLGMTPLKNVQMAVNLRTAKHLGLVFSPRQQQGFDLVFTGQ
jgi:putative tryptophan/tyrosine transport system substrate-binding protein